MPPVYDEPLKYFFTFFNCSFGSHYKMSRVGHSHINPPLPFPSKIGLMDQAKFMEKALSFHSTTSKGWVSSS